MSGEHESSMPQEIQRSLCDEPPVRRPHYERLWSLLDETGEGEPRVPSTDEAWITLLESFDADDAAMHRAPDRRAVHRRRSVAAIAVTVVAVILAGFWWMSRPVTVSTPAGAQQTVQLPDGSTVELNSETSIRFARGGIPLPLEAFSSRRVSLNGEAYFRVVPALNPFVVATDEADVEVLGTEFNVLARGGPAEEGTYVTLASGTVRLTARSRSVNAVTLSEVGETAYVSRAADEIRLTSGKAAPLDHVLAWRRSGFAVVNRPLESVLNEVERRYAIEIAPRDGVDLTDSMSAFYLRGATPDQILRDICLVQACTYRETSRGFAVSARDTTASSAADGPTADRTSRPK